MTPDTLPRAVPWLLIGGAIVFWIGAATPPYRQWMGVPLEEYLAIVGDHRRNWQLMHALFTLGTLVGLAGLAATCGHLQSFGGKAWAHVAIVLFGVAAILWLGQVAFRLSMTPWAAAELARTGGVPGVYVAAHRGTGLLFAAYMALTYLGQVALGAALLACPQFCPRWAGWTAVAFGLVAVPGLATPVFQPPLMLHVVPFVVGIALRRG